MKEKDFKAIELDLFLEAIFRRYGHDFRNYARASLRRRVAKTLERIGIDNPVEAIPLLLRQDSLFNDFLRDMSVTVTDMFRDPGFYRAFREKVIPHLRTYPMAKVWHAGCATGEEVYSMAIVLKEEGLLERTRIYATDYNNESLDRAAEGIYPVKQMKKYMDNYNHTGAKASFSDYYHTNYGAARLVDSLRDSMTFANHNLVTDGVFSEMNVVICRNVLIYFDKTLKNRALSLFRDSLCHRGFLCLGSKESLSYSSVAQEFETVSPKERIFRKR
jgi:chemotaxis protein methyltransferase CheR